MKIKNATIKDFDTAYEYIKKLWDYNTYDYETTKEVYEKVLQDENSFAFFSIEDDGTFHGFCHGDYFQTFWMSGLTCYVSSLITNEEDRGKGYGVNLLDHAKKLAKERGCDEEYDRMSNKLGGRTMKTKVYHGTIETVENPICAFGRKNLDFGQGFYVTDIREQAVKWAVLIAQKRKEHPVINRYLLDKEALLKEARCKVFESYNAEWLEFIVASRKGLNPSVDYDYIEGGIANDRVIDTVNLYISGLMSSDVALKRLAMHRPNNQICLLNQSLTDKYLEYDGTESAE